MIAATTGFAGHANNAQQADCERHKSLIEIIATGYSWTTDIQTYIQTNAYIHTYTDISIHTYKHAPI